MPNVWCIYHVKNSPHTRPIPKNKFVVIVCNDDKYYWGFFINTEVREFIKKHQKMLKCQVPIKLSQYSFLDYDSYINCVELYPFDKNKLTDRKSVVNIVTKAEIKKVVKDSETIETYLIKLILQNQ
jgi:hypothetical protein